MLDNATGPCVAMASRYRDHLIRCLQTDNPIQLPFRALGRASHRGNVHFRAQLCVLNANFALSRPLVLGLHSIRSGDLTLTPNKPSFLYYFAFHSYSRLPDFLYLDYLWVVWEFDFACYRMPCGFSLEAGNICYFSTCRAPRPSSLALFETYIPDFARRLTQPRSFD